MNFFLVNQFLANQDEPKKSIYGKKWPNMVGLFNRVPTSIRNNVITLFLFISDKMRLSEVSHMYYNEFRVDYGQRVELLRNYQLQLKLYWGHYSYLKMNMQMSDCNGDEIYIYILIPYADI